MSASSIKGTQLHGPTLVCCDSLVQLTARAIRAGRFPGSSSRHLWGGGRGEEVRGGGGGGGGGQRVGIKG